LISCLRGWRRKKRQTSEEFADEFELWIKKANKQSTMRKTYGLSYGRPQLIHKGRKPNG
jgi:hypothetical protein